jgi:predicted NUDIX family NTP pyrophosphohydrolase
MKKHSAGLVAYRLKNGQLEVLAAHMGAPWWAKKDVGAWSIPKGLVEDGEEPIAAAKREFSEELGLPVPKGDYLELGTIEQQNNKSVTAWAVEHDVRLDHIKGNTFEMEWPPRSGQTQTFPEIDRAEWLPIEVAAAKLVRGQEQLLHRLADKLSYRLNQSGGGVEKPKQNSLF